MRVTTRVLSGSLAAPSLSEGRGFILGNAGVFYAFDYN